LVYTSRNEVGQRTTFQSCRSARLQASARALARMLHFTKEDRVARVVGHELLFALENTARTASGPRMAMAISKAGSGLAERWHQLITKDYYESIVSDPDRLMETVHGLYSARFFGIKCAATLRDAAARFGGLGFQGLLGFDPSRCPPPLKLPTVCKCGTSNGRRRRRCRNCGKPLDFDSAFRLWQHALVITHLGKALGGTFGASFESVVRWRELMMQRYFDRSQTFGSDTERLYAVTHLVYTLADYGCFSLPSQPLLAEVDLLEESLAVSLEREDVEGVGESLECLRILQSGRSGLMRKGTTFLIEAQNCDGSWGRTTGAWYDRLHRTWVAFDALRDWSRPGGSRSVKWVQRLTKMSKRVRL
jgi:hypothetical protein